MKNLSRVAAVTLAATTMFTAASASPVTATVAAQSLNDEPLSTEAPVVTPSASGFPGADEHADKDHKSPATTTRDTRNCPYRLTPPPPVDTSEEPAPGQVTPAPLSVPDKPVGGAKLASCEVAASDGFTVPADIAASSWAVIDVKTGDVIAAKDPHGRYRPASVIKVLLALVVLDELKLNQKIEATYDDAAIEGSRAGIVEGNEYTVQLLLQGLLMNSGNDCGSALIRALGGNEAALAKVNAKAKALGATDTRVGNPTGLDSPGQSTSAFDLGLFYAAAFNSKQFADLAATTLVTMPGNKEKDIPDFEMSNDNQLLASGYEGALGGKTGFTDDARHTFVGVAERDGRRLAAVVLDTTAVEKRAWQQAAELLDAGFSTRPGVAVGSLKDLPKPDDNALADAKNHLRDFFGGDEQKAGAETATNAENANSSSSSLLSRDGAIGVGVALAALALIGLAMRGLSGRKKRRR